MKEIKKYTNIIRYGKPSTAEVVQKGDYITITEKLDGANSSFCYDNSNLSGVSCYSKETVLNEKITLRGFYDYVLKEITPIKNKLNPDYRYYGEWLVKHKVAYKPEVYGNFYLFSIWDDKKEQYLADDIVISEAERLGLRTVPYLYRGKYISFEHLMSFVGKSENTLEPNTGEGVVVKNASYFNRSGKQVFVKLVSQRFAEVQKQKVPRNPNINEKEIALVKSVLTIGRVEKLIHKLVDEGQLKEDFNIQDMGIILRLLGSKVYDDIMKEEAELFKDYESSLIKRITGKNTPNIIKQILKEKIND